MQPTSLEILVLVVPMVWLEFVELHPHLAIKRELLIVADKHKVTSQRAFLFSSGSASILDETGATLSMPRDRPTRT